MAKLIPSVVLGLAAIALALSDSQSSIPGHMQPLGSHREPELVQRLSVPPSPLQFAEYVSAKRPVVFDQLMTNTEVLKNWRSDSYLKYVTSHFY